MDESHIYEQLNAITEEVLGLDGVVLTPNMTAEDVEGWDSFTHINIMIAVEQRFNVRFATQEVESIKKIGDLAKLIQFHLHRP